MRSWDEIVSIATVRKGGPEALQEILETYGSGNGPVEHVSMGQELSDDRYLAQMTRCIFQAGFAWKVVDAKWAGFEEAFEQFEVGALAVKPEDAYTHLRSDKRIIRNWPKIRTVPHNARFVWDIAEQYGSFYNFLQQWPSDDTVGLWNFLKKHGSRLGGRTGPMFLRFSGYDTFLLSRDGVGRLIEEGVIHKDPTSKRDLQAVQEAFNAWREESGKSFTEISRVLALSWDAS